ncbi:GNAT family N-acetyltransferase [Sporosarcina sp. YIM B06819]|uniref:GNAT family N-acetyltransferase n=1 Tax=Sporosarcina sp. YIM B06819 TaxID=3081769 RepID=UPI00298CFDE9|nr:GNAT family N-acetyltransferase [Sporosarcina sp. YIM B06819]
MLTTEQLHAIEVLQKECEQADTIQLKLNWDMLRQRDDQSMDFFYEENGQLIAYLALYGFGSTVEVCGMVKPSKRRNHHFSTLWQQALQVIAEKGFRKIILNAPASSVSAKAWLATQHCTYTFSEFQMQWTQQALEASEDVVIRLALPTDAAFEIQLDVVAFNMSEEDARHHYEDVKDRTEEQRFIIVVDGTDVGKIRVSTIDGESYIYGFAILPEFQGKGYGGKALRNIVKQQHQAGYSIGLDVEAKNMHALRLYETIGFKTIQAQDYYLWD